MKAIAIHETIENREVFGKVILTLAEQCLVNEGRRDEGRTESARFQCEG